MKKITLLLFVLANLMGYSQNKAIDSLKNVLANAKEDSTKLKTLNGLFTAFRATDATLAKNYANEAVVQGEKTPNAKNNALALYNKAVFNGELGNFDSSDSLLEKSMQVYTQIKDVKGVAYCLMALGNNHYDKSEFVAALNFYLKSALLRDSIHDKKGLSGSYIWIGNVYHNGLFQDVMALNYYNKALKLQLELNDEAYLSFTYNNIGNAYYGLKKYPEALGNMLKSVSIKEKQGNRKGLAASYNNIGSVYYDLGEYDKALDYYNNSLKIRIEFKDPSGIATSYVNMGNVYLKKKDFTQAVSLHKMALEKAKEALYKEGIKEALVGLAAAYEGKKDFAQALDYLKQAKTAQDSLLNQGFVAQIADAQTKYETEKKENENKLLQKDNEVKNIQISKGRLTQLFLVGGILLLVVVFYLLYNRNKLKQKQAMNAELLHQQELRSKAIIEAEEKERTRIARELHDGIGQQLSAAKLNISGLQASLNTNKDEEKVMIQNAIDLIDESVKEVRVVSHSMMPNALIKSGLVSAVREFINKISSSGSLKVNLEIIGLTERLEQTIETVLFRVLQELVNNIIKHAQASQVSIQLIRHETELTILIEDNGVGFNVDKVLEKEGGIGLKNIQSRVAFLNGEVFFDSQPNKGTTVTIEIPT
ncbi:MAG: sensor histidine kinase [Bacteroidia bacterium]